MKKTMIKSSIKTEENIVIPAKAGIQAHSLDSRFRGNDRKDLFSDSLRMKNEELDQCLIPRRGRGIFGFKLRAIRRVIALSLFFLLPSSFILHTSKAMAQDLYAGYFLQIPVGSRALSMGGAYPAIADDESAFHWNPAGVSLVPHQLAGFMYSAEFGTPGNSLADFYQVGFTLPLKDVTLAGNWVRLSVGDLNQTPDLTNISVTDERAQLVQE